MNAEQSLKELTRAIKSDNSYAWSWHCNIAMSHLDAMARAGYNIGKIEREAANQGAAGFMKQLFDVDTTKFEEYKNI
jgi:hypothetical protein